MAAQISSDGTITGLGTGSTNIFLTARHTACISPAIVFEVYLHTILARNT